MNAVEWLVYAAAWQAWFGPRGKASEWDALAIVLTEGNRRIRE